MKKRTIVLIAILLLVVAGICLVVGGTLAGWDIVGGLTSSTAMLVYLILAIAGFVALYLLFNKKE